MNQRLRQVLADQQSGDSKCCIDGDSDQDSLDLRERRGDDERDTYQWECQSLDEIGPRANRRRWPQPAQNLILEAVGTLAVRDDPGQDGECKESRQGRDSQLVARHAIKLCDAASVQGGVRSCWPTGFNTVNGDELLVKASVLAPSGSGSSFSDKLFDGSIRHWQGGSSPMGQVGVTGARST